MSITDLKNKLETPATKYWEWSGSQGKFFFYDKEKKDKFYQDSLLFIILNQTSFIKGWSDQESVGIYSNFIKDFKTQKLTVKTFNNNLIAEGLYSEIKDKIKSAGASYNKGVFIYNLESKEIEHITFKGSSLTPIIELKNKFKDGNCISLTKNPEPKKKGATIYFEPLAKVKVMEVDDFETALLKGEIVDDYIKNYFKQKNYDQKIEEEAKIIEEEIDIENITFEEPQHPDTYVTTPY